MAKDEEKGKGKAAEQVNGVKDGDDAKDEKDKKTAENGVKPAPEGRRSSPRGAYCTES